MTWRRRAARLATVAALLGAAGALAILAGIVPIEASSGHWRITRWFFEFTKRRTIEAHTLFAEQPVFDEPWLVPKGAGHYDTGCAPCHGSPASPMPRVPAAMTSPPQYLPLRVQLWDPDELVHIVEHGIKFTGMPAWPARGRRDEVRAVVAFLLELPRLDAEQYRRLVHGDEPAAPHGAALPALGGTPAPRAVIEICARCHGRDGLGRGNAAFPRLAGQRVEYLVLALEAYARGARHSGIMEPIAAALSAADRREVAEYYATRTPAAPLPPDAAVADAAQIERGRVLATSGVPARGVPACIDCHGPWPLPRNAAYPDLAGQFAPYLELQLELFARGSRGGSPFAHLMADVAPRLTASERRDAAAWYASLPIGGGDRTR